MLKKANTIKWLVLIIWMCGFVFLIGNQIVKSSKMSSTEYTDLISATYDFRFGKDKPFAPSNANTHDGQFMAKENFISSARCGTCHTDTHPQWRESAHANSFREPFYQKNVNDLVAQKNIAFTRHCESCHNPAALFTGALTDEPAFKERPFDQEGVSCIVCHSIETVNGKGVGGYVFGQPAMLQKEDGSKVLDATDQDILNDIPSHKRAMMRPLLKQPEFCASCHKSQVPQELNNYKFLRAFAVGDELQMSSFSKESPHPFYVRNKETCNTCHMADVKTKYFDASAKDGTISSHRWAAANTAIPTFYGYTDQLEEVTKTLQNDVMGIDIFALYRKAKTEKTEQQIAPINRQNFKIAESDTLTADVVITNKNIGHSFPPELRDFYEAYVEFTAVDFNGKTIYKSGFIKPNGYLDDNAHAYKTYLVKNDGSFNDLHHIWFTKTVAHNLQIPSGRSDVARYRFNVPKNLGGEIKLTAKLKYRRFTRVFSDYSLGGSKDLPIVEMAKSERILKIGENLSHPVDPKAMPDWRRFNNYGIALLDQRQFNKSAEMFGKVMELDEKYRPFALTNRALALMEIDRWDDAKALIDKGLELEPNNLRAVFQRGRIFRIKGKLAEAEADFKRVNEAYPRDRLTLQQLGELAKIKSDTVPKTDRKAQLELAKAYYEQILAIDPEDIGATYNMMLVLQKLGKRAESAKYSKTFQDLKDDPKATPVANDFLQKNPSLAKRTLPYYVNDMKPFQTKWAKSDYPAFLSLK